MGLEPVLSNLNAMLTLFASTNEAFEALSVDTQAKVDMDNVYLLDVLWYYITINGLVSCLNI